MGQYNGAFSSRLHPKHAVCFPDWVRWDAFISRLCHSTPSLSCPPVFKLDLWNSQGWAVASYSNQSSQEPFDPLLPSLLHTSSPLFSAIIACERSLFDNAFMPNHYLRRVSKSVMCTVCSEKKDARAPAEDKHISHRHDVSIISVQDMSCSVNLMLRKKRDTEREGTTAGRTEQTCFAWQADRLDKFHDSLTYAHVQPIKISGNNRK